MLGNQGLTLFLLYVGEYLYVTLCILVTYIQPELVELVGRSVLGVEPNVTTLGLTELSAVRFGYKRTCKRKALGSVNSADQFGAGGNVTSLIGTTHLQLTVLMLVKIQKIVTLK